MSSISKVGGVLVALLFAVMWVAPAQAQASRTWVSGVGDDVNPCSRTAPCKTFAGAISKTAAGGEIDVLDPGGYGGVTITKSMTIDGSGGSVAGVLVSSSNGITVNDSGAGTAVVTLRNLDMEGFGFNTQGSPPGVRGVWFISGAALSVQHCVIRNFREATNGTGIAFTPSGASKLFVDDTILTGNGNGSNGGGIVIKPTGSGSARALLSHVSLENNSNVGLSVDTTGVSGANGNNATIADSSVSGNPTGISVTAPGGAAPSILNVIRVEVVNNPNVGIVTNGPNAAGRVGGSHITGGTTGVSELTSSAMFSYGDNMVDGNAGDGAFTPPKLTKI